MTLLQTMVRNPDRFGKVVLQASATTCSTAAAVLVKRLLRRSKPVTRQTEPPKQWLATHTLRATIQLPWPR